MSIHGVRIFDARAKVIVDPNCYQFISRELRSVVPLVLDAYFKVALRDTANFEKYARSASFELARSLKSAPSSKLSKRGYQQCPIIRGFMIFGMISFVLFLFYFRALVIKVYCSKHVCDADSTDIYNM
jgi:hypothetical protein